MMRKNHIPNPMEVRVNHYHYPKPMEVKLMEARPMEVRVTVSTLILVFPDL